METTTTLRPSTLQCLHEQQLSRYEESIRIKRKKDAAADDLELKTNQIVVKENSDIASKEELKSLQEQIRVLKLQHSQQESALKDKSAEVVSIRHRLEEERAVLTGACSSGAPAQRIVELSRKNRELHAELATEKNRTRQLQNKLRDFQETQQREQEKRGKEKGKAVICDTGQPEQQYQAVVAKLQQQLAQSTVKMTDYRNQCQLLKQDIRLAHKVLSREVGEGVSVSALLADPTSTSWKGRAQQIITLQNKVSELQRKMLQQQKRSTRHTNTADGYGSSLSASERQKAVVAKIETERRKTMEETRSDLHQLQEEYGKLKQQYSALKARNRTLTEGNNELKTQVALLSTALSDMESLKTKQAKSERDCGDKWQREYDRVLQENTRLSTELSTSKSEIRSLREKIKQLQSETSSSAGQHVNQPLTAAQSSSLSSHSPSCNTSSCSLPPLPNLPHHWEDTKRRDKERSSHTYRRQSVSAESIPVIRQQVYSEEVATLMKVSDIEKHKLSELNKVLNKRLECAEVSVLSAEEEVCRLRQQNLTLERQLGRLKCGRSQNPEDNDHSKLLERLAVQEDENTVLKEMLKLVREEKEQELRLMSSLLQEARLTFTETISRLETS